MRRECTAGYIDGSMPDTPRARAGQALLAALRAGTEEALTAFVNEHLSERMRSVGFTYYGIGTK